MPLEEGLRLDQGQGFPPIEEPRQRDHRQADRRGSPSWCNFSFLKQSELPAQEEIPGDQRGACGKQQSEEGEQYAF